MIFDYKLYIFDLDGTIIDSEYSHYLSYNEQLNQKISFNEYENIFHNENKKKKFISDNSICKIKKENDFINIYSKNKKLIEGFEIFLNELIERGKDIIIVTNSSNSRVSYILSEHPILNNVKQIISKNEMKKVKPNPECYINVINNSKYKIDEIIIFEDSFTGYQALENIEIEKIFICTKKYYYYDNIKTLNKYDNYINIFEKFIPNYDKSVNQKFLDYNSKYSEILLKNNENIFKMHTLIKCLLKSNKQNIYFIGVGKSNIIAQKSASTWRSLGLSVYNLECEELWHGGFGIFNNNNKSIIIYLTNSGNTSELINVANHIKENFNLIQVCITCNPNNKIKNYVDYTFNLTNNLDEIGIIKKAPTISSFLFMNFLDTLGILITDNIISSKLFSLYHPGGILGIANNKIDYVVISACGKGTRLKPITNYIPKILVNIGIDNLLTAQIKYWINYVDNFIIIVEPEYNSIIDFYFKLYNVNYIIKNVEINNNEENAFTLQKALNNCEEILDKKVIITWCDILLTDELDLNKLNNENMIFTYGNESRYYCEPNKIYKQNNGNVIGCFFISKMQNIVSTNIQNDICDIFLDNFKNFNIYNLNNLIDIGDMVKLDFYFSNKNNEYKTRFFNHIDEIENNKLVKKCIHNYGKSIIDIEIKYYKYISQYKLNFPKIFYYGEDYFIMEKIDNAINLNKIKINENILNLIINGINKIHNCKVKNVDKETYDKDLQIEFYSKILNRIKEVKTIIEFINPETVNDVFIEKNINVIMEDLYKRIYEKIKNKCEYHLIHGDCQFSNTLYNEKDNTIYFIDPRGYFGDTLFFGIKEYDYSKLLYAISGYDKFNNDDKYYFTFENNNLNTNINTDSIFKYRHIFEKNNIDFELCVYIMIIHWLGLSSYNKNNVNKCISSYYYGIYLYHIYV